MAGRDSQDDFVKKLADAVDRAKKNREWRREYMTLLMRDQENIEKGIQQGIQQMVENVLKATRSIQKTAELLTLGEEMVRNVADSKGISVTD